MKIKRHLVFLILLFLRINYLIATPSISNVVISPINNIGVYDKLEITFSMNNYTNPYDPAIINSYCEFWSPSGKYFKVFSFYYQDFTKTNSNCTPSTPIMDASSPINFTKTNSNYTPFLCEILTPNGINNWKIRFTPNELGNWQYKITATDNTGSITYPNTNTLNFTCTPSSNRGFIVKANNMFLKRTTGEFFFPVGQNIPDYRSPSWYGNQTYGTNEYKYYIDNMAAANANFIRVWLDVYTSMAIIGKDFITNETYFDLYNQKDAFQLDWIISYAKSKDINIMLCFFTHASWGDSGYCDNNWTLRNPFNSSNGGPISSPFQFFNIYNSPVITRTKNIIKHIVSRWGYATNLVAWELWNEVDHFVKYNPTIIAPGSFPNDVHLWHDTMFYYIKSIDPFKHLITTSFGGEFDSDTQVFSLMDITQSHDYKDPINETSSNFQDHFFQVAKTYQQYYNKPYMSGEWGFFLKEDHYDGFWLDSDPKGFELHNSLWSSAFSTAFGAVSNWFWDTYIMNGNLFHYYKPISSFMNSLPVLSSQFEPKKIVSVNGLRTYYMMNSNNDTILGWTQDINFHYQNLRKTETGIQYLHTLNPLYKPNPSSSNNEITIQVNQNNRQYIVNWYNAVTGVAFQSNIVTSSNNQVKIIMPITLRKSTFGDAVFSIHLDCSKYVWREGILSSNTYANVAGNVVCNMATSQVFYKTHDNKIHSMWWDQVTNSWQWSALNNAANNVAGDLAIVQNGSQVFYRTLDNKINSIWWNSAIANWEWSGLNQAANGNVRGPLCVSQSGQVFFRTLDYKINSISYISLLKKWVLSDLNNPLSGNVGEAMAISSTNQVFYKTLDNKLQSIWKDPSTGLWVWAPLNYAANENVCGNITITPNDQVFYRTCNNTLNNVWYNYSTGLWSRSELNNAATNVAGDLMADYAGKVFYRNTNSNINCIYWSNGSWHFSNLDNSTNNNVYPGNLATDNYDNVFFRCSDNKVHRVYYKSQCYYNPSANFHKNDIFETNLSENAINETVDGASKPDILLYPNPAENKLIVVSKEQIKSIYVYNLCGQLIEVANDLSVNKIEIDVSLYVEGFYFVKAYLANDQSNNLKFVVKH